MTAAAETVDAVTLALEAEQDAGRFLQRLPRTCGDGGELYRELQTIAVRPEAYKRSWFRVLQKALERGAG